MSVNTIQFFKIHIGMRHFLNFGFPKKSRFLSVDSLISCTATPNITARLIFQFAHQIRFVFHNRSSFQQFDILVVKTVNGAGVVWLLGRCRLGVRPVSGVVWVLGRCRLGVRPVSFGC